MKTKPNEPKSELFVLRLRNPHGRSLEFALTVRELPDHLDMRFDYLGSSPSNDGKRLVNDWFLSCLKPYASDPRPKRFTSSLRPKKA